ncbi:hypothetical protein AFLA_009402 [Aspergillus flavus NRRL3357]|nr:hypothetical protein AFLA_009402 [Aspergillus flavus NRRL3357]
MWGFLRVAEPTLRENNNLSPTTSVPHTDGGSRVLSERLAYWIGIESAPSALLQLSPQSCCPSATLITEPGFSSPFGLSLSITWSTRAPFPIYPTYFPSEVANPYLFDSHLDPGSPQSL